MISIVLCPVCKHYNRENRGTCAAFPKGIPDEIFFGKIKHVLPMSGDGGIVFEPEDEEAAWMTQEIVDEELRYRQTEVR